MRSGGNSSFLVCKKWSETAIVSKIEEVFIILLYDCRDFGSGDFSLGVFDYEKQEGLLCNNMELLKRIRPNEICAGDEMGGVILSKALLIW